MSEAVFVKQMISLVLFIVCNMKTKDYLTHFYPDVYGRVFHVKLYKIYINEFKMSVK